MNISAVGRVLTRHSQQAGLKPDLRSEPMGIHRGVEVLL
jgi:hypothetical protein